MIHLRGVGGRVGVRGGKRVVEGGGGRGVKGLSEDVGVLLIVYLQGWVIDKHHQ